MMSITHAGLSDVGKLRQQNEDRWFADAADGIFLVADGIGGHAAGDVASGIVVELLPKLLRRTLRDVSDMTEPTVAANVEECLRELSEHLHQASEEKRSTRGMGAAIVLALIRNKHVLISHLGDCRGYLLTDRRLEQLTSDHTLTQLLLDAEEISDSEALVHPGRHQLTRFVGMPTETLPETRIAPLSPNSRLLLCSDGLSGALSKPQLVDVLTSRKPPYETCRLLVSAANESSGDDNVTAVVIDIHNCAN